MTSFGVMGSSLLDKIDRLFECNVGDSVALPQIVVVGDQSSGKSSVLEGLTGLPFPRASGLCTRFATQITFRRSIVSQITVSIIPANNSGLQDRERLQGWKKSELKSLDSASFASIMAEVVEVMGLDCSEEKTPKTFSNDVLRLEIAGPDQEHFSVIDVPGIFKRTTQGLTTKEDIAMVNTMVHDYMSNPRSVMLTVIPCNVDIATQEILERAEDLDPDGIRTFGILTKPDLVDKGSESAIISLIEGRAHHLRLGWHLLRNPGQADLTSSSEERREIERRFFTRESPWNTLDEGKVGVESLRARLQEVLEDHIRREFPKVKAEVSQKLKKAEKDLKSLGPKRQTEAEQRQYLMDIALEFQNIASLAVHSDYSRSNILNTNAKFRIATEAVNRGQKFADAMATHGHRYGFMAKSEDTIEITENVDTDLTIPTNYEEYRVEKSDDREQDSSSEIISGTEDGRPDIRTEDDHLDIQDLVHTNIKLPRPSNEDILVWLKTEYRGSRGFELGTFDASLLGNTMKQQADKWRDLALGYVSDVISLVHSFILGVLGHITPNERVCDGIRAHLADDAARMYQNAMSQTEFLISVELDGTPATYNHYFNDTLEKCGQERLLSRMEKHSIHNHELGKVVRLKDVLQNDSMSNDDHTILKIHDILSSYYKVARKRFVDCVRMQVADTLLVTGSKTPLTLFSAKFVTCMTPEALEDIAGEDSVVKRRREDLEKKIRQLQEGKRIIG